MSCPAKQSVAPGKDWSAAMKQEGMGSHWQLLDQEARTKFQEILEEQSFAHRVIARHMRQLPSMPSMGDQDVIIFLIRRFLDQTKGHATVEDAAIYLARSSWDVRLASYRWIDPETYAAMAKDELWGDEKNDEGNLPNIHETVQPVVHNHPTLQREIQYPAGEETLDSTASVKTPNIAASDKTVQPAVTTAPLNTTAMTFDLNRSPAVKGQVRPDKFTIVLEQPDHKTYKKWCFPQHNKGENFDWQNMEHIRSLNKWRTQIFRRTLGSSKPGPVPFHKEELDWVTKRFVLHKKAALKHGVEPAYHTMNWDNIAKSFNERFEGETLPDCETPRPHRTKSSIQTQRYRIEAISELTGVPMKGATSKIKKLARATTSGESPKVKTRPRRGTTGKGKESSKTVERAKSADATNDNTTNDSNTAARSNATTDEEEESSDGEDISEEENAYSYQ